MISLKNDFVSITVNEVGAELSSIKDASGRDYQWSGDAAWWTGRAPVMFPICGGLRDNKCEIDGAEYEIPKHGFAKKSTFEVESSSDSSAVFLLKSSEATKALYPYDFEFRVSFELVKNSVKISYTVLNKDTKTLFCSVGAHEAYATPEGIEEYKVVFEKPETLRAYILDGNLLEHKYITVMENGTDFDLKDDYFKVDALVFKDLKSRCATLVHKATGRKVRVDFDGFNYFLLWHKYGAPYICLEPWCGVQDPVDSAMKLSIKEGINAVNPGDSLVKTHIITVG